MGLSQRGLRLRWDDFDGQALLLTIQRSVIGQHEDDIKTPESTQDVPIHADLAAVLLDWKEKVKPINGWIFGNPMTGRPYWRGVMQQDHLEPACKRAASLALGGTASSTPTAPTWPSSAKRWRCSRR